MERRLRHRPSLLGCAQNTERQLLQLSMSCATLCLFGFLITTRRDFLSDRVAIFNRQLSFYPKLSQDQPIKFQWQEIFTDFYVYSAYYTFNQFPELHAVVIANATDTNFWTTTICYCVYHQTDTYRRKLMRSKLERLPEAHRDEYRTVTAGRLRCQYPDSGQIWSRVELKCHYKRLNIRGVASLPVPPVPTDPPPKLSFAHCGTPMFGGFDRPARIVEFVEYYKLMGVSKFFWYELGVSNRTRAVMDYYEREGTMEVTRWSIPQAVGRRIHYYGQLAVIYDCFLRTSMHYDYTIFSDLDEFFATSRKPATFASIVDNGKLDCVLLQSAFMHPNATYADQLDPVSSLPILQTATITERDKFVFWTKVRSKYICRGLKIDVPRIHYVKQFRGQPRVGHPEPEDTDILLHFRSGGSFTNATTLETRALANQAELAVNVANVWTNVFLPERKLN